MTKILASLVQHDKVISKFGQQQLVIDELCVCFFVVLQTVPNQKRGNILNE